jgi:hypothetical protein
MLGGINKSDIISTLQIDFLFFSPSQSTTDPEPSTSISHHLYHGDQQRVDHDRPGEEFGL